MTGAPTPQVLLDDGSGSFSLDITSSVMLNRGISVNSYGRTDESPIAQASTLTLTLDNTDGSLTTGVGFGLLSFGFGPFGGGSTLTPGLRIRCLLTKGATTATRFTGRVSGLALGFPGGGQEQAEITITASDALADLARRPMRSMLEEEVLLLSPTAYFTLGEAEGATSAGDTSGNQAQPMIIAGTGTALTFGSGSGPVDGLSAVTLAGGKYLATAGTATATTPAAASFGCAFAFVSPITDTPLLVMDNGAWLQADSSGHVTYLPAGVGTTVDSGVSLADGSTHVILVTVVTSGAVTLYVDGVSVATGSSIFNAAPSAITSVGGGAVGISGNPSLTGTVSHVAHFPTALTGTQAASISGAAHGASETSAARFARIATYVGLTTSTPANSGVLMGAQSTSGTSALDALMAVAAAEGGVAFANGSGTLVLQGHGYRSQKTIADVTLTSDEVSPDTAVTYDTQQLINQATVTRTNGAAQVVQDSASIASNGTYSTSLDLAVAADSDALSAAQWLVNKHSAPSIRLASATLDPLTSTNAELILARQIGDRLALSPLPSQTWSGAGDVVLEGWSETVTHDSWQMTANLLPWSLFQSGIYDDAGSLYDAAVYA